jgi:hypothetical protein
MALEQEIEASGLREQVNHLRDWQCQRLLISYSDLYLQKKYKAAVDFFTDELYGANDFSKRDRDIKKVLPMMEAVLSSKNMVTFEIALQLNTLSYQLDIDLVRRLDIDLVRRLDSNQKITTDTYAKAYRECDNLILREQQLNQIGLLANNLGDIANRASVMLMLKICRKPAKLAGLGELQSILEKGAKAFQKIGKIEDFIEPILSGEKQIMRQLFKGNNCLPMF